ncbi:16S rRNA (cytidine1402-2'-O)-methyltransferase [Filimonas zeae]|uniref:S-adenosylmethionine-dependent methyltransferase n=1 Tax=Filimonas zeae TaxID=1737353 RepID=A0A917J4Q3_9BACT|nr:SAM-dependent methyltransferase [Filimonas zeae]MDR6341898.1 16S rRNA (cytidine1402-2'-O)-methyltransferase [Filimonas zeae]GGH79904.1 S-adenosylmethionine-dependent methyltransferase [Filimonas zeae]
MSLGVVYLIPTVLHEEEQALQVLPSYILDAIKQCDSFFAENEKTARRFFKKLWREMVIDNYSWFAIHKAEEAVTNAFVQQLQQGKNIGIISEAGCPGVADPGQILVAAAQKAGAVVKPLVGPSSILLALMASGMNGQGFRFHGYLPIDGVDRKKAIRELEADSQKQNCTQLFIETPYRNNQLVGDILQTCRPETRLCIAADITASTENIRTRTIKEWKQQVPDVHKKPVIFLLHA